MPAQLILQQRQRYQLIMLKKVSRRLCFQGLGTRPTGENERSSVHAAETLQNLGLCLVRVSMARSPQCSPGPKTLEADVRPRASRPCLLEALRMAWKSAQTAASDVRAPTRIWLDTHRHPPLTWRSRPRAASARGEAPSTVHAQRRWRQSAAAS